MVKVKEVVFFLVTFCLIVASWYLPIFCLLSYFAIISYRMSALLDKGFGEKLMASVIIFASIFISWLFTTITTAFVLTYFMALLLPYLIYFVAASLIVMYFYVLTESINKALNIDRINAWHFSFFLAFAFSILLLRFKYAPYILDATWHKTDFLATAVLIIIAYGYYHLIKFSMRKNYDFS